MCYKCNICITWRTYVASLRFTCTYLLVMEQCTLQQSLLSLPPPFTMVNTKGEEEEEKIVEVFSAASSYWPWEMANRKQEFYMLKLLIPFICLFLPPPFPLTAPSPPAQLLCPVPPQIRRWCGDKPSPILMIVDVWCFVLMGQSIGIVLWIYFHPNGIWNDSVTISEVFSSLGRKHIL